MYINILQQSWSKPMTRAQVQWTGAKGQGLGQGERRVTPVRSAPVAFAVSCVVAVLAIAVALIFNLHLLPAWRWQDNGNTAQ